MPRLSTVRRPLTAIVILALAAAWSYALAAAESPEPEQTSRHPDYGSPVARVALRRELDREEQRRAARDTSEAKERRKRSLSAHAGYSDAEALALGRSSFGTQFTRPAWHPLALGPGQSVTRYTGTYSARVHDDSAGHDSFVESNLPLRSDVGSRSPDPIDLTLEDRGGAYEPANPLVATSIPKHLSDGFALKHAGLDFRLLAAADVTARTTDEKAFYGNVDRDTDILVTPLVAGVETFTQLRSAASPERLRISFSLPNGATLDAADGGGVDVVRHGYPIARLGAASASDASGQAVPVRYSIDGQSVAMTVEHRGGDYEYPILVDPVVEDAIVEHFGPSDWAEWRWASIAAPGNTPSPYPYGPPPSSIGLWHGIPGGHSYNDGDRAEWQWFAPGTTRIDEIDFSGVDTQPSGTCVILGIYGYGWEGSPNWQCNVTLAQYSYSHCVGTHSVNGTCPQVGGTNGNYGIYTLWVLGSGYRAGPASSLLRGSTVWIHDWVAPPVPSVTAPPSDWVSNTTVSQTVTATDGGLGAKYAEVSVPQNGGGSSVQRATNSCTGDHSNRCPATWRSAPDNSWSPTLSYGTSSMPEGANTVSTTVVDVVGNRSASISSTVKVDRTAPAVALSGPLKEAADAGETVSDTEYGLGIDASDRQGSVATAGVKNVTISVDGTQQDFSGDQSCPTDSCAFDYDWLYDPKSYGAGEHTVTIRVRDHAGNLTETSFTVTSEPSAGGCGAPRSAVYWSGGAVGAYSHSRTSQFCESYDAEAGRNSAVVFEYGDCDPNAVTLEEGAACVTPVQVQSAPLCERHAALYTTGVEATQAYPHQDLVIRGVPAASFDDGTVLEVYTGTTAISVQGEDPTLVRAAADQVRLAPQFGQSGQNPPVPLPLPDVSVLLSKKECTA